MRDIKFRLWDKTKRQMTLVSDISFGDDGSALTIMPQPAPKGKYYRELVYGENCVLMQYTGIEDSKGQEIYEGDIIKTAQRGMVPPFIGRVYWFESEFQWWITDDINNPITGIDYDITFLRSYLLYNVIGNIYENSDLLKSERVKA